MQSGGGGDKLTSSKEIDLGSTAAFNKLGNIVVIESKNPPPGGGRDAGKSVLGLSIMLDCTHGG